MYEFGDSKIVIGDAGSLEGSSVELNVEIPEAYRPYLGIDYKQYDLQIPEEFVDPLTGEPYPLQPDIQLIQQQIATMLSEYRMIEMAKGGFFINRKNPKQIAEMTQWEKVTMPNHFRHAGVMRQKYENLITRRSKIHQELLTRDLRRNIMNTEVILDKGTLIGSGLFTKEVTLPIAVFVDFIDTTGLMSQSLPDYSRLHVPRGHLSKVTPR